MNRMKWLSAVVILSLLLTTVGVALAQEPTPAAGGAPPLKMSIILKNLVNPYFVAMGEGAKAALSAFDYLIRTPVLETSEMLAAT